MKITYFPLAQIIQEPNEWSPYGGWLSAWMHMPAALVELHGLNVQISVSVNAELLVTEEWPRPGIKPKKITVHSTETDQIVPLCMQMKAKWMPEDNVSIYVRILTNNMLNKGLGPVLKTFDFVAPIPMQSYPSWIWEDGFWTPPVPYPADGKDYVWDEDALAWVHIP